MNDHAFVQRYMSGDVEAQKRLNDVDLRIARGQHGNLRLDDRDPAPSDYTFNTGVKYPSATPEQVRAYNEPLSKLAADLRFSPEHARSFVDMHLEAAKREASQTPQERANYGREQERLFVRVMGENGSERAKQAQDVLHRLTGRSMDIAAIVRSNGAELAIALIHQAESLARRAF